jgi:hypothetical protein
MATKAGRVHLKDIRQGVTLWVAAIDKDTGRRVPAPIIIERGAQKTPPDYWIFFMVYNGERRVSGHGHHTQPLDHNGEPIFDKLFVNRAAAARWIKRYESNRIETLCEDRRVFKYGSHFIRRSGINTANLADNMFVSTEQWLVKEAHYVRHLPLPESKAV